MTAPKRFINFSLKFHWLPPNVPYSEHHLVSIKLSTTLNNYSKCADKNPTCFTESQNYRNFYNKFLSVTDSFKQPSSSSPQFLPEPRSTLPLLPNYTPPARAAPYRAALRALPRIRILTTSSGAAPPPRIRIRRLGHSSAGNAADDRVGRLFAPDRRR